MAEGRPSMSLPTVVLTEVLKVAGPAVGMRMTARANADPEQSRVGGRVGSWACDVELLCVQHCWHVTLMDINHTITQ